MFYCEDYTEDYIYNIEMDHLLGITVQSSAANNIYLLPEDTGIYNI